jgi:hypothetical protein
MNRLAAKYGISGNGLAKICRRLDIPYPARGHWAATPPDKRSGKRQYLTLLSADSVIVTGTTTSGCVRATVIDAFSLNYRVTVAEDGCFDRSQASHAVNLCDMNAKYADVVAKSEIVDHIMAQTDTLFPNLPTGRSPV